MTHSPVTLISAMTVAQARAAIHREVFRIWSGGELPHEVLDSINLIAETAVEALVCVSEGADLDLAEGPLDVISAALRRTGALGHDDAGEVGVLVYEALIDANHLPGVNAQRVCTDSLDAELET